MAKIVAFVGSPRNSGYSRVLLDELAKGVESAGGTMTYYDLNDPRFRGCQGCYACREQPYCRIEDNLRPFYDEVGGVDGIVVTSPIYFADISGQVKSWVDRMFATLDGKTLSPRHPGKNVVTLFAQGDTNPLRFSEAIHKLHGWFTIFGWRLYGNLVCTGVGAEHFSVSDALKSEAFKLGAGLARGG